MPKQTARRYNWKPDRPDHRDHLFSPGLVAEAVVKKIDLRPKCSPVVDQGQIGSCTGNALAGAVEFLDLAEKFAASRLFIYYNERVIEGDPEQDGGAQIRDGIKSLAKQGVCSEHSWGYQPSKLFKKPADKCYAEAATRKITEYLRVANSTTAIKACLAAGFPIAFGFTVYESFESDAVAKTGKMPMPAKKEKNLGGHAVLMVGYDDATQCFIVRNSWGLGWGDKGHFYMPYANLANASDFWTIRKTQG